MNQTEKKMEAPCVALRGVTGGTLRPGGFVLTDRMVLRCALRPGMRLLDIGCGSGESVEYLRSVHRMEAEGIDTSEELLVLGRRRTPGLPIRFGSAEAPVSGASMYDAVFSECAFSGFADRHAVLASAHRILKEDGWLIISDIYDRSRENTASPPELRLDPDGMTGLLAKSGFSVAFVEEHSRLLRELAARLIFKYGSVEAAFAGCGGCKRCGFCRSDRKAGQGYYLLGARKKM